MRGLQRLTLRGGWAGVKSKNYRPSGRSDPEALLQVAHAVPRDGELGLSGILEADQHPAVHRGEQLLHERDVHDGRAVDAREAPRIELRVEIAEREVDHMLVAVDDGEGELVLRHDVADLRDVEHRRPFADA